MLGHRRAFAPKFLSSRISLQRVVVASQTRSFTQSPSPQTSTPSIFDGWNGIKAYYDRVQSRFDVFDRYEKNKVFCPDTSLFERFFQFAKLQVPSNTEIDAIEFLVGAQHAIDLATNTIFSPQVRQFACGEIEESPAVNKLQSILNSTSFYKVIRCIDDIDTVQLNSLTINSIHVTDVTWMEGTLAHRISSERLRTWEVNELIRRRRELIKISRGEPATEKPEQEVLQPEMMDDNSFGTDDKNKSVQVLEITVRVDSVENITTGNEGEEQKTLDRHKIGYWTFESLVTQPEDIDWRIIQQGAIR